MFDKQKQIRSKEYRTYVKQLPCVVTERPGCDPHHPKGHGLGGSVKCSDIFCIPLSREEHTKFHNMGWETWEGIHGLQPIFSLKTIEQAFRDEFLIINPNYKL